MAQINLAPGSRYVAVARRRRRTMYGASLLVVLALAAVWGAVELLARRAQAQLDQAKQELVSVEANITRAGEDVERIELFEKRLAALNQLLDKHHSWENLFADLERLLPPQTVLTEVVAVAENNSVTIAGHTPSIDAVAQTFASLTASDTVAQPSIFTSATINSVRRENITDPEGNVTGTSFVFSADLATRPANEI